MTMSWSHGSVLYNNNRRNVRIICSLHTIGEREKGGWGVTGRKKNKGRKEGREERRDGEYWID